MLFLFARVSNVDFFLLSIVFDPSFGGCIFTLGSFGAAVERIPVLVTVARSSDTS